jgi:hypothetical protein
MHLSELDYYHLVVGFQMFKPSGYHLIVGRQTTGQSRRKSLRKTPIFASRPPIFAGMLPITVRGPLLSATSLPFVAAKVPLLSASVAALLPFQSSSVMILVARSRSVFPPAFGPL